MKKSEKFNELECIQHLRHYLPAQSPLKDFIHHNTLHAFQSKSFHEALHYSSEIFGYKVYLSLEEYRLQYEGNKINKNIVDQIIEEKKGVENKHIWIENLLSKQFNETLNPRIGSIRSNWKSSFKIDLDALVHPLLFRTIGSYLDQGVSIWNFPTTDLGFLKSIQELEKNSLVSLFKTARVKSIILKDRIQIYDLLEILVGNESFFEQYLYDQQFSHPGWSGIVATVEENPNTLLDSRKIKLTDFIIFELLLEIDALDSVFGEIWSPLGNKIPKQPVDLFQKVITSELFETYALWQEIVEWNYYNNVLLGLSKTNSNTTISTSKTSFQSIFCIDDRECSIRRHIETIDDHCKTFGTPGHFNVEFYYQPSNSDFYTKVCPAPLTPKYLIQEKANTSKLKKDLHFSNRTNGLLGGSLYTHTIGFWSAIKLFFNVFSPKENESCVSSFKHMDKHSVLTIENHGETNIDGLNIGFTIDEMTDRVEGLLKSIGLVDNFAPIIYSIGHGSSSVNNTHYAGYDCGACSGRPGSVNARVISLMANHPEVRIKLVVRGIKIPEETQFIGGLHDTSRDEIVFYDIKQLSDLNYKSHLVNETSFDQALRLNAKERSRKFMSINSSKSSKSVHKKVKLRSVSLFEPRPELNHATNTLCIVGRRDFSKEVFLDRRSFLNSYDYTIDPTGKYLLNILNAVAPVCGGINLEYYFSRVDNQKLGAGTKLPHNVMGLFGVANGTDGDLRTGLPSQMIEVHDPLRLMVIVEHFPEIVLETIKKNPATFEWFANDWIKLVVSNPETRKMSLLKKDVFIDYQPLETQLGKLTDVERLVESTEEILPVYLINKM
jgi:uncharacterized protein